jgi:hypothetical protein
VCYATPLYWFNGSGNSDASETGQISRLFQEIRNG